MKNTKKVFFITILVMLLIGLTAISAANDTSQDSTTSKNTHIEQSTVQKDTTVIKNTEKQKIITKNNNKTVKQDTSTIDYYVSDNTGSDTNTGTSTSPFKTIQTALDKTSADNTYNIHILEGTYKGFGNTNLTVNGNYNINLMGEVNKTVIDGEAKYDIDTEQYHWGSSDIWSFYVNGTGNWIMNITKGTGNIKLTNMTIQNSWTPGINGGDAIDKYPIATIDNYGNLEVDNVYFLNNHGGVGSAIRNNYNALLLVNNSVFIGNRKSESTGNDGIIYNNGTSLIKNSLFDKNYGRWGTILNDNKITVINTTLSNNMGYDGQSTYSYGAGIASNTGFADFYKQYDVETFNEIINCTFINNDDNDIYSANGHLNATGNKFINSAGFYVVDSEERKSNYNISNNNFEGIKSRSMYVGTTYNNAIINNNTINIENGTAIRVINGNITNNQINYGNGTGIEINGNGTEVINNTINGNNVAITISENSNTVKNNNIITNSTYAIQLGRTRYNTIDSNYIIAKNLFGNYAVNPFSTRNNIVNNLPEVEESSIFVSPEVTTNQEGTLTNPTTITDALSKVKENATIILLSGDNNKYLLTNPIVINSETISAETTAFTITGMDYYPELDGQNRINIFDIGEGYNVKISNLVLTNGNNPTGGIIKTQSNISIYNTTFKDSEANVGGAIYSEGNIDVTIKNSTFKNITSKNETIYLNSTGNKILNDNKYIDSSIETNSIEINTESYPKVLINDNVIINIKDIIIKNPQFYDENILDNINYMIFENDINTQNITTKSFNINTEKPINITTYVKPEFQKNYSNSLKFEVSYDNKRNVIINTPDMVSMGESTIATTLIDEFGLNVTEGTVSYYINNELIGTVNIEDSTAKINIPNYPEGEYTILTTYNDTTNQYNNASTTSTLQVINTIYVSSSITEASLGTQDKPTTLTDALNKIRDNKTIILLSGEYLIDSSYNINEINVPNAKKFTIEGTDNVIFNGQKTTDFFKIGENYDITFKNIKFTNARTTQITNEGNAITNNGKLTLNNTIFENNYGTNNMGLIRSNSNSQLIIDENNVFNNNNGTCIVVYNANLTINNNNSFTNSIIAGSGSVIQGNLMNLSINGNNTFSNNNASSSGGAIWMSSNSIALIEGNNLFINNTANTGGALYIATLESSIKGVSFINNTANEGGAVYMNGGNFSDNLFINNYASRKGAAINQVGKNIFTIINNTFINNTSVLETIYLNNIQTEKIIENNSYINSSIGINIQISLPEQVNPIKVNDELKINVDKIELINPAFYDENLLNKTTFLVYLNDKNDQNITTDTTQFTITLRESNENTIFIKPNIINKTSNVITVDVELDNLKNVQIIVEKQVVNQGETATIIIEIKDKSNNPVEGGIVTIYDNQGNIFSQNNTINGVATLITEPITFLGTQELVVTYNNTQIYNNKTTTLTIVGLTSNIYVSPDVTTPQEGTLTNPTTLTDALNKISNYGTIYFLYGNNGIYNLDQQIIINSNTINKGVNTFNMTSYDKSVTIDANKINSLITIATGYDITLNNISIINAPNIAIYNNGNLTLNGKVIYENNNATDAGGLVYNNRGNLIITGQNTFKNHGANQGAVIYLNQGNLTIIGENTFSDNIVTKQGGVIAGTGNLIINGSNKFINNKAIGSQYLYGGAIYLSLGDMIITGNNLFDNNQVSGQAYLYGGAFSLANVNFNIEGNNTFSNNKIVANRMAYGSVFYLSGSQRKMNIKGNLFSNNSIKSGTGAVINVNSLTNSVLNIEENIFEYNNATSTGVIGMVSNNDTVIIYNNTFRGNYLGSDGIIYVMFSTNNKDTVNITKNILTENTASKYVIYFQCLMSGNKNITVSNNSFTDNNALNETIYFSSNFARKIENNIYNNTPIGMKKLDLTSEIAEQEITINRNIPLNINAELLNPSCYDEDILEKLNYEIFINDVSILNSTSKEIEVLSFYDEKTDGILNIYAKSGNKTSNNITVTVIKPVISTTNITTENPIVGESTELIATFGDEYGQPVTGGFAIFRVNGKTLRDNDGNVIYVPVVDGKAELPDVNITAEWMKPDTSIQAVYSGTDEYDSIITEKTYINVTKPEATISITSPTESAAPGQTVTLTASVTDNNVPISSGRVVFKLNGKTLKDETGKALYVNVANGVANITYTLPVKTKANTYKLTAVYTDSMYDRVQADVDFVVTA